MKLGKRYFLTGTTIVSLLIGLVSAVRFTTGTSVLPSDANPKAKGPKDAPIQLVEYSDFQCPACKLALEPVEELRNQFPNVMRVEFRHYPLSGVHRWALMAATFSECAAEQGKFWEFHDRLFKEQETWSHAPNAAPLLVGYAQEINLDRRKLESCMENTKAADRIRGEYGSGSKQGVESTPTFFLNGHILVGSIQLKEKAPALIAEELKKQGQKNGGS